MLVFLWNKFFCMPILTKQAKDSLPLPSLPHRRSQEDSSLHKKKLGKLDHRPKKKAFYKAGTVKNQRRPVLPEKRKTKTWRSPRQRRASRTRCIFRLAWQVDGWMKISPSIAEKKKFAGFHSRDEPFARDMCLNSAIQRDREAPWPPCPTSWHRHGPTTRH